MRLWAAAVLCLLPVASMSETLWVDSFDGCRLRVLSQGSGPALVLVPGWTMTAEIWQGQMDFFSKDHRVVSFDPRGQGLSGKPAHGYDSRRRARDIHELIRHLHLGPAVLLG
jgi:non-heme chloroperoxidase